MQQVVRLLTLERYHDAVDALNTLNTVKVVIEGAGDEWKAEATSRLCSIRPSSSWALHVTKDEKKREFFSCLKTCFHILENTREALACEYEMLNASESERVPFLWQQWMHYAESCSTQGYQRQAAVGFEKAVNELGKLSEDAMSKVQRSVVLTYCYLERAKCFQESGKPVEAAAAQQVARSYA